MRRRVSDIVRESSTLECCSASMAGVTEYELAHKYETVNYHRSGGAAKVELNRPERLNAWNEQFSRDLQAALDAAAQDPDGRAVLLTGAGRGFSSGADISG